MAPAMRGCVSVFLAAILCFDCIKSDFDVLELNRDTLHPITYTNDSYYNNPQYYRYLKLIPEMESLYVGAQNQIILLTLRNITLNPVRIQLDPSVEDKRSCAGNLNVSPDVPDCQNHIRDIQLDSSGALYACGTGGYAPKIYKISPDLDSVQLTKSGEGYCPFDFLDNSTSVLRISGNKHFVFTGVNSDFLKESPVIAKHSLHNNGSKADDEVRTQTIGEDWLKSPQFTGSFVANDTAMFFFRENSTDYRPYFHLPVSRVAKVCTDDKGKDKIWLSYQKARLICMPPGDHPDLYQIQYVESKDSRIFYALFTKDINGIRVSVICVYTTHDLSRVFNGPQRKRRQIHNGKLYTIWEVEPNGATPRPGNCSVYGPSAAMSINTDDYILMSEEVKPFRSMPVYNITGTLFTRLELGLNVSGENNTVIFAASVEGKVFKLALYSNSDHAILLAIYSIFNNPIPIRSMVLHDSSLYIGTDFSISQTSAVICSHYVMVDSCILDPHCGWSKEGKACKPVKAGDSYLIAYSHLDRTKPLETEIDRLLNNWDNNHYRVRVKLNNDLLLHLNYTMRFKGEPHWNFNEDIIRYNDRVFLTKDNSLAILNFQRTNAGIYKVQDGTSRVVVGGFIVELEGNRATTLDSCFDRYLFMLLLLFVVCNLLFWDGYFLAFFI